KYLYFHPTRHTYISAILLTHLIRQDRVFNEIRQLNRFWCRYLSYTALICSSLFCFTLYISTMTKAVWFMKLFFISVSLPPISILIIGTWEGAKPFEDTMKMYHSQAMLLCHYGGINWHIQLKVRVNYWLRTLLRDHFYFSDFQYNGID